MITEFRELLKPKKVYIPLTCVDYKIANVKVQVDETVLAGTVVAEKFKGKVKLPVISSVSGTVVGFEERLDRFGKIVDHIVIENDGLNNAVELEAFENATSSQVRKVIYNMGIERINVDGIFTPIKFDLPIDHIVVNAIYTNEPFISTDYTFLTKHSELVADGVMLIAKAANCESITVIVDKYMPSEALYNLGKAIVDKNINLLTIDTKKVKGSAERYIGKLVGKVLDPNLLNSGVIYTKVDTAKMIADVVKNGVVPTSRQIAITGDGVKVNAIYEVKIGTPLTDIIDDLEGYNEVESMVLHVGNFLTGIQLTDDSVSITANIDSINLAEYSEVEEDVCIKCGDCNDVCPVGILPQNIMDAELRSVNSRIVELNTHECIECGLCSYVCPSKINVLEWVRRAKRRVG